MWSVILRPSGFDTIMRKTLATATVDRLLHHAHIVLTEGASYRLVSPLLLLLTSFSSISSFFLTQREG